MKKIEGYLRKLKNKSILFVFSHPDDESVYSGGLIQVAQKMGFRVTVLVLTEGGRGKIFVNGKGRSVYEIRRQEMASAMAHLGVVDWVMWKFDDGKLKNSLGWRDRLGEMITQSKPGLVVSFDLSGVTGHPDHIATGLEVLRIVKEVGSGTKLLWVSYSGLVSGYMVSNKVKKYLVSPRYYLRLGLVESARKWLAAFSHKSQNLSNYVGGPWLKLIYQNRTEWYSEPNLKQKYRYRYVRFVL